VRRVALVSRLGLLRLCGTGGFLVALLVDALGTEIFTPISMLYVHVVARLPLPAIGVVLTIAMVLTLPLTPLTGALVDRFGARRLVIASHLLQAMGFLGCHFARKTDSGTLDEAVFSVPIRDGRGDNRCATKGRRGPISIITRDSPALVT